MELHLFSHLQFMITRFDRDSSIYFSMMPYVQIFKMYNAGVFVQVGVWEETFFLSEMKTTWNITTDYRDSFLKVIMRS